MVLALSPDGSRVATEDMPTETSGSGTDKGDRKEGLSRDRASSMRDLAFSDEGSKLVSIGHEGRPDLGCNDRCLAVDSGVAKTLVESRMSLLPGGRQLVEAAHDGSVRLWNVEGEEPPVNLSPGLETRAQGNVAKIASGNGQRLAVANNRQIGVWDVTRRTRLLLLDFDLLGVPTFLGAFALSSDGTRLASGNEDGIIRVWEVPSGQLLYQFKAHAGPVRSIAFNPAGTRLVSSSAYTDRSVRIWRVPPRRVVIPVSVPDLETTGVWIGEPVLTLDHDSAVMGAAMSADGATLATWDRGGLNLWHGESAYSVEARNTVDVLRERGLTSLDVISALTADRAINPDVRRDALKYAAALGDSPSVLSYAARKLAFVPGRQPDAYRRAVTLAEAGVRAAPGDAREDSCTRFWARRTTESADTPTPSTVYRPLRGSIQNQTPPTWRSPRWRSNGSVSLSLRAAPWKSSKPWPRSKKFPLIAFLSTRGRHWAARPLRWSVVSRPEVTSVSLAGPHESNPKSRWPSSRR